VFHFKIALFLLQFRKVRGIIKPRTGSAMQTWLRKNIYEILEIN